MGSKSQFVDSKVLQYIKAHSLREPKLLAELREETSKLSNAVMQVPPEEGQLLALLVQATGARRCLEIGTFTGYSALSVALALPEDGRLHCCDVNEEWTNIGKRYWKRAGVANKIELHLAPALKTLDRMLAGPHEDGPVHFDFAFIDADKPNYDAYYERCLKLVRTGGLIVFDNMLWSGAVADNSDQTENTKALRALNDKLHQDERVTVSLLAVGDGMSLAFKR
jgi:predicted O-methyltransferase YrrM